MEECTSGWRKFVVGDKIKEANEGGEVGLVWRRGGFLFVVELGVGGFGVECVGLEHVHAVCEGS